MALRSFSLLLVAVVLTCPARAPQCWPQSFSCSFSTALADDLPSTGGGLFEISPEIEAEEGPGEVDPAYTRDRNAERPPGSLKFGQVAMEEVELKEGMKTLLKWLRKNGVQGVDKKTAVIKYYALEPPAEGEKDADESTQSAGSVADIRPRPELGFRATQALVPFQSLFTVHQNLMVSADSVLQSEPGLAPYNVTSDEESSWWSALAVVAAWLLRERAKGNESFWYPYLRLLPSYVPTPVVYPDAVLQELDYNHFAIQVEETRRGFEREYKKCDKAAIANASLSEFMWALSVLTSRCFSSQPSDMTTEAAVQAEAPSPEMLLDPSSDPDWGSQAQCGSKMCGALLAEAEAGATEAVFEAPQKQAEAGATEGTPDPSSERDAPLGGTGGAGSVQSGAEEKEALQDPMGEQEPPREPMGEQDPLREPMGEQDPPREPVAGQDPMGSPVKEQQGTAEDPLGPAVKDGKFSMPLMLVPFADLINHELYYNSFWRIYPDKFEILTTEAVSPGAVIRATYGGKSADEFLLSYGFIPRENPSDRAVLFYRLDEVLTHFAKCFFAEGQFETDIDVDKAVELATEAEAEVTTLFMSNQFQHFRDSQPNIVEQATYYTWVGARVEPRLLAALGAVWFKWKNGMDVDLKKLAKASIVYGQALIDTNCTELAERFSDFVGEAMAMAAQMVRKRAEQLLEVGTSFKTSLHEDRIRLRQLRWCKNGGLEKAEEVERGFEYDAEQEAADMGLEFHVSQCTPFVMRWARELELLLQLRLARKLILQDAVDRMGWTCDPDFEEFRQAV